MTLTSENKEFGKALLGATGVCMLHAMVGGIIVWLIGNISIIAIAIITFIAPIFLAPLYIYFIVDLFIEREPNPNRNE